MSRSTLELLLSATRKRPVRGEDVRAFLAQVTHLRLEGRRLKRLEGLDVCCNVRVLYLYDNSLTRLEGLHSCELLSHLYLQNNRINRLENLESLTALQKLYLDGNCLEEIGGLEACTQLQELHAPDQRPPSNSPLVFSPSSLVAIQSHLVVLNIADNRIIDPAPLAVLTRLQVLNLENNRIEGWEGLLEMLSGCCALKDLTLLGNPITKTREYRDCVVVHGSALAVLDRKSITENERQFLYSREALRRRRVQGSKRI